MSGPDRRGIAAARRKAMKELTALGKPRPCPTCGSCPTCGKAAAPAYPRPYPYWVGDNPNTTYRGVL